LVLCDAHDYGCYGGWTDTAFKYVVEANGLASEKDYPYGVDGHTPCLAN